MYARMNGVDAKARMAVKCTVSLSNLSSNGLGGAFWRRGVGELGMSQRILWRY